MNNKSNYSRIWELDFFRGIALILMVYFHIVYDLSAIFGFSINYSFGINYYIGKLAAILFIFISGISSTLSKNNLPRGIKVFSFGLLLTLITYLFYKNQLIQFGILHFLGSCIILTYFFEKLETKWLYLIGCLTALIGYFFLRITIDFEYLFFIGLRNSNFSSADYYPIIPWLCFFLSGIIVGRTLYQEKTSCFTFHLGKNPVSYVGNHTLLIYLLHQPIIIGVLYLVTTK